MLPLDEGLVFHPERSEPLLELDEALTRLMQHDSRASRIIELRFFGGLSVDETAEVLNISPRTVKREWTFGRAWLRTELGLDGGDGSKPVE
jgi:RNA polymerase sigma factor (TIGR02999 family)